MYLLRFPSLPTIYSCFLYFFPFVALSVVEDSAALEHRLKLYGNAKRRSTSFLDDSSSHHVCSRERPAGNSLPVTVSASLVLL